MRNKPALKHLIEAALFTCEEPLTAAKISELFAGHEHQNIQHVNDALADLQHDYADRGIELKQIASGWRFQARQETSAWLKKLWPERPSKYSRVLLETLALIAYRQPITRAEIEAIRGVAVNPNVIKTLLERAWIKVVGHREAPGKPELLGTSKIFLDYFNLKSLSDLPSLQIIQNLDLLDSNVEIQFPLLEQQAQSTETQT